VTSTKKGFSVHNDLDLTAMDPSGAIAEAEDRIDGETRADFFRKMGIAGGSALAASMFSLPGAALAATPKPSAKEDIAILNFALTLEFLENEFYLLAIQKGGLTGDVAAVTKIVSKHESTHVAALKTALGSKAIKKPTFTFGTATENQDEFIKTAIKLEDTGVMAYSGAGGLIFNKKILAKAVSILTVEARHASAFRRLGKENFAPLAFDKPADMATVLAGASKFIVKK
jgi:hypothetical protein